MFKVARDERNIVSSRKESRTIAEHSAAASRFALVPDVKHQRATPPGELLLELYVKLLHQSRELTAAIRAEVVGSKRYVELATYGPCTTSPDPPRSSGRQAPRLR